MSQTQPLSSKIHNLSESVTVLEYIINLLEKKGYHFADDDAPHYINEMKKVVQYIRDTRDSIANLVETKT
jgi:hypothetical protein